MGLFNREKKTCGICGKELGLLGKRKLEDGYLCKDCISKLSPFFSERRHSTVADIEDQLAYREANKDRVAAFHATRTLGNNMKVIIDEDAHTFIVTRSRHWEDGNPDVIDFSQVTGCRVNVDEDRREIVRDSDDQRDAYLPPRYEYDYDVDVVITVNSPYFDDIKVDIASGVADVPGSAEVRSAERIANEIHDVLTSAREGVREAVAAANAPRMAVTCPHCRATTIPDASGRCEYCGGAITG